METKVIHRHPAKSWLLLCALLIFVGLLSGCAADIDELRDSARAYVRAVHDARREIRRECWEILMDEVDSLRDAGKHAEARERLAANYPPLVTVDVLKSLEADPIGVLSDPFGCS